MRRTLLCCALFVFAFPARAEWHLQWKQTLPQRVAAWEFVPKMGRDTAYEITPVGSLAVVTTEFDGSVRAFDTASGREQWRFHTNGPIRSAAVAADDAIVVGSEDGFLYCLEQDGRLRWSVCGGPRERLVLGHGRLISAWPVAAKPAVHAGKVYFVAGYWPVNGIYHHAVDLKTGTIEWTNSAAQFRPFGVMDVADGVLTVTGHPSGGRYDITTGAAVAAQPAAATPPKDKTTVAEPRPAFPDASNVTFQVVRQAAGFAEAFVGTSQAEILCYRESPPAKAVVHEPLKPAQNAGEAAPRKIDVDAGYAILVNPTVATITAALQKPALHVIALVEQPEMARDLRTVAEAHGLYEGRRLDIRSGPIVAGVLPPYIANYVGCEAQHAAALQECVRPYGGILAAGATTTRRSGSLPGADDWRQEFHDAANTLASRDTRIKTPLGTLWYGGDAADLRFYFDANVDHQSGDQINPQPVGARFVDGRMILQGPGLLGGFDMYTGRKLWETKLPLMFRFGGSGGGLGVHSKKYPKPWEHPEAVAAEVPVTQHCRASGFNMVALPDGVFVAAHRHILRIDPDSGRQLSAWPVPPALDETGLFWGGLHAEGNVLVASLFREQTMIDCQAGFDGQGGDFGGDRMPMAHLVAIDKTTGEILWTRKAVWGFLNRSGVALSSTRVFAVDACEEKVMAKLREAGRELPQDPPRILALDLKTGKEIWKRDMDVLMRGLVYSAPRDLLLAANRHFTPWKDGGWAKGAKGAAGRMRALKGENGETAWETDAAAFFDPHIMLDDLIIDRQGVTYDLRTGERHRRTSPLTGTPEEWSFQKAGCNHLIACDTMVTWRCAVYDLAGQAGTLPLAGMDAGCTPTLVPAGGLLNIPNFGTHHKRNRMTAMALVHVPENTAWTRFEMAAQKNAAAAPIKKAGFDLGAPGDRVAQDGTLWLAVGPRSRGVQVAPQTTTWFEIPRGDVPSFVDTTGAAGITDLSIPLVVGGKAAQGSGGKMTVDVTLTFVEPENVAAGKRVFSVSVAGQEAVKDLDIAKEAGGPRRMITRTIQGVEADGVLPIRLTASVGEPVLCGVEIRTR